MRKRHELILRVCICAMLLAIAVVLKGVSYEINRFRFGFYEAPVFLSGMFSGFAFGGIIGFATDLLYWILFSKFPYSFIMALSPVCWGIFGAIFYKRKVKFFHLLMAVLFVSLLTTGINSIQLYIWYKEGMFADLPLRLITRFIQWPITTFLIYTLNKRVIETLPNLDHDLKIITPAVAHNRPKLKRYKKRRTLQLKKIQ